MAEEREAWTGRGVAEEDGEDAFADVVAVMTSRFLGVHVCAEWGRGGLECVKEGRDEVDAVGVGEDERGAAEVVVGARLPSSSSRTGGPTNAARCGKVGVDYFAELATGDGVEHVAYVEGDWRTRREAGLGEEERRSSFWRQPCSRKEQGRAGRRRGWRSGTTAGTGREGGGGRARWGRVLEPSVGGGRGVGLRVAGGRGSSPGFEVKYYPGSEGLSYVRHPDTRPAVPLWMS